MNKVILLTLLLFQCVSYVLGYDLSYSEDKLVAKLDGKDSFLGSESLRKLAERDPYFSDEFHAFTGVILWDFLERFPKGNTISRLDLESFSLSNSIERTEDFISNLDRPLVCNGDNQDLIESAGIEYSTGLSPVAVGLGTFNGITDGWLSTGPSRPCPHSGIDIGSNRTNQPFKAGVYGVITSSCSGVNNAIDIQLLHDPLVTVRFLHSQSCKVSVGQYVNPWTVLGNTGDTGSEGTGIHLHISAFRGNGNPQHSCWASGNNYFDPLTVSRPDLLSGNWQYIERNVPNDYRYQTLRLSVGDGSGNGSLSLKSIFQRRWCFISKDSRYSGTVSSSISDIFFQMQPGSCTVSYEGCVDNGPPKCYPEMQPMNAALEVLSPITLSFGRRVIFTRTGGKSKVSDNYQSPEEPKIEIIRDVFNGSFKTQTKDLP